MEEGEYELSSEITVSGDEEPQSSDDDLQVLADHKRLPKLTALESESEEEKKEDGPKERPALKERNTEIKVLGEVRKPEKGEIAVIFEYVEPSPAYYHSVKALMNACLDGEAQTKLDYIGLTDHILERRSIG